jgi:DNA-binding transcriptional ArsR family regulator/uncharacterized protein YndB with AHSA1/START domain
MMMQMVWKALADPVRRDILDLLRQEPRTTGEICESFEHITRFGVLSHLNVLKDAGLVQVERRGRERINRIDPEPLREAYEKWIRNYEGLWAGRLERIKKVAEGQNVRMAENSLPTARIVTLDVEQEIDLKAAPADVFRALTLDIGEWWGHPYLFEDARDIVMDPVPGGLVRQVTRDGGGNVMYFVQEIRRDRRLVLNGKMAMPNAIAGTVEFDLRSVRSGFTRLRLHHWAIGDLAPELHAHFSRGWTDLLDERLRLFVERGESKGVRASKG